MTNRKYITLLVLWLTCLRLLSAQTAPSHNHNFAAHMGSGIYTVRGSSSHIYRAGGSLTLISPYTHRWGLTVRLTGAAGFFDYEMMDFFNEGLPRTVSSLAFFPSMEVQLLVTPNWLFSPFVGWGAGIEVEHRSHQWFAGAGMRNLFVFPLRNWDLRLNSRLLYCELLKKSFRPFDDFGMIESGIEFRRPLGIELFGLQLNGSIFSANYIYQTGPRLLVTAAGPTFRQTEWEFGFTLGMSETICIWKVKLPRVGLSYRFGSDREGIRILAGDSFPIRSPRGETIRRFNLLLREQH